MKMTEAEKAAAHRAIEKMKMRQEAERVATKIEETTGEPCSCEQVLNHWVKNGRKPKS